MLKKLVSISLIGTILLTLIRFTLPYLWYYSNQSYIATELCIHQHRTDHECDGTCQLKKMVQKQHDRGDGHPQQSIEKEQKVNLFFAIYISTIIPIPSPSSFKIKNAEAATLWIREPILPPPQIG